MRFLAAAILFLIAVPARAEFDASLVERKVGEVAADVGGGRLGVGILDLKSGQDWYLAGDERFPMQSVFKAPLGVAVLRQVDRKKLGLDQTVTITRRDVAMGWSPIAKDMAGDRKSVAVRELVRGAVSLSDNTAADVLMRLIGGPAAVTAALMESDIAGLRVDRYERELQPELAGLPPYAPGVTIDPAEWKNAVAAVPEERKAAALQTYLSTDERDTATPKAAVAFLAKLDRGALLSADMTAVMIRAMAESPTGAQRLKAGLPAGARLAHKTGTGPDVLGLNAATNDIGIVTLPGGATFAIAVFLAGSALPEAQREAVHARVMAILAEAAR